MTQTMPEAGSPGPTRWRRLLRRWPSLAGLLAAVAALLAGADRETVGIVVAVAATCYLTSAALGRPWAAWAAIPGSILAITVGGLLGAEPLTTLAITAAALLSVGLITRASRTALTAETAAVLGYGGLVVTGLAIAPTAGLVLVAVTLIAHGAWDAVHLRRGIVVAGSLAEFCVALDIPLGLAVLVGLLIA